MSNPTNLVHLETNPRIPSCDPTLEVLRHSYKILPVHLIDLMCLVEEKGKCRQSVSVEGVNWIEVVRCSDLVEPDKVEVDSFEVELYVERDLLSTFRMT